MNVGRLEELINDSEKINNKGGLPRDEWILFQLTHINLSLATIADCLRKGDEKDEQHD